MSEEIEVFREEDLTDVVEVIGHVCEEFLGVRDGETGSPRYFYLKLSGLYHRFYLDAGCLFWRSHQEPDSDYDFDLGGSYINLGEELQVLGAVMERIHMEECLLEIAFGNGVKLEIRKEVFGDETDMKIV